VHSNSLTIAAALWVGKFLLVVVLRATKFQAANSGLGQIVAFRSEVDPARQYETKQEKMMIVSCISSASVTVL